MPRVVTRWGLFETAPKHARRKALDWQRHIREVESGLPDGPGTGQVPRAEYDPTGSRSRSARKPWPRS